MSPWPVETFECMPIVPILPILPILSILLLIVTIPTILSILSILSIHASLRKYQIGKAYQHSILCFLMFSLFSDVFRLAVQISLCSGLLHNRSVSIGSCFQWRTHIEIL